MHNIAIECTYILLGMALASTASIIRLEDLVSTHSKHTVRLALSAIRVTVCWRTPTGRVCENIVGTIVVSLNFLRIMPSINLLFISISKQSSAKCFEHTRLSLSGINFLGSISSRWSLVSHSTRTESGFAGTLVNIIESSPVFPVVLEQLKAMHVGILTFAAVKLRFKRNNNRWIENRTQWLLKGRDEWGQNAEPRIDVINHSIFTSISGELHSNGTPHAPCRCAYRVVVQSYCNVLWTCIKKYFFHM
jgi:hypothetical protein